MRRQTEGTWGEMPRRLPVSLEAEASVPRLCAALAATVHNNDTICQVRLLNPDKPLRRSFTVTSNWPEQSPLFCPRPFSQEGAALLSGPVLTLGNMASPSAEGSMTHSSGALCFMSRLTHNTTVCVCMCVLLEDDTLSHAAATFYS